ncbi:hypothetical protein OE766_18665 [Pararhizobium sp. YC-54]|nr:hypothetical protein [Pararhizobium sp. YC-54]MCW0000262.1 hypothetical protein [Pararhizobium sp. YC-54]
MIETARETVERVRAVWEPEEKKNLPTAAKVADKANTRADG